MRRDTSARLPQRVTASHDEEEGDVQGNGVREDHQKDRCRGARPGDQLVGEKQQSQEPRNPHDEDEGNFVRGPHYSASRDMRG